MRSGPPIRWGGTRIGAAGLWGGFGWLWLYTREGPLHG